jgi:protein O-GlcNAc transferase
MLLTLLKSLFATDKLNSGERAVTSSPNASAPSPTDSKTQADAFLRSGQWEQAAAGYRRALDANPDDAYLWLNLGCALKEQGAVAEAKQSLQRAASLSPGLADAFYLLAVIEHAQGDLPSAINHFQRVHQLDPSMEPVYRDLCRALFEAGDLGAAHDIIGQGIRRNPRRADFHHFLGNLHMHQSALDRAIASFETALALDPAYVEVLSNLGEALVRKGDLARAISVLKQALSIRPDLAGAHHTLLCAMSFDGAVTPEQYIDEARRYGGKVRDAARAFQDWPALRSPSGGLNGPLKVGLVSGDLRMHPVGYFLESVLSKLDLSRIELTAYPTQDEEDELTARLKRYCAHWTPIGSLPDDAAALRIREDGIHVLVDLAGHTAHNRLSVFAWKPAPVQVSWLGYWASTGVAEIDYLLADRASVPEGQGQYFSEKIWWLPETRLCFTAPAEALSVMPPPAVKTGYITFGSFQNLSKIDDAALALWARVMQALPTSRLRLQAKQLGDDTTREALLRRLSRAGITAGRVTLAGPSTRHDYLAAHEEIDMILDTFPFPGGTTTCEALWMGVPTVTLMGQTLLSRQGASLLRCAGLPEWVALDEDQYVEKAVAEAGDVERLTRLRATLREQVLASPLFDGERFARQLEQALSGMWAGLTLNSSISVTS